MSAVGWFLGCGAGWGGLAKHQLSWAIAGHEYFFKMGLRVLFPATLFKRYLNAI